MRGHALAKSVAQALEEAIASLKGVGCDTPRLDAEVLLACVVGRNRAWLYAHPEYLLPASQLSRYHSLLARRAGREPLAYLTGFKEFYGLEFLVTPGVLIPRPETERLIEIALQWASAAPQEKVIVDVATGSGAIAVTLAVHLRQAHIIATDNSSSALAVARRNALRHSVAERVDYVQANLLAPLSANLHLIVANPPYLSWADLAAGQPEVAEWEPRNALDGGEDGLTVIDRLLAMAASRLRPGGALLVEIGADQGTAALNLARHYFPEGQIDIDTDYARRDRVLVVNAAR